jgi:hypothetical protein
MNQRLDKSMLIRGNADTSIAIYDRAAVATSSNRISTRTGTSEDYAYEMTVTFNTTAHYNSSNSTEKKKDKKSSSR